jgi:hypothetical protein
MAHSKSVIGTRVLQAAVVLGALGDALLRATPWGINIGLWILMLLIAVMALAGPGTRVRLPGTLLITAAAMLFFAGGFAWRDSAVLRGLDALGLGVSAGLLVWQSCGGKPGQAGFTHYVTGIAQATGQTAVGLPHLLAREIEWSGVAQARVLRQTPALLAGLVLAVPLVLLFGGLFLAADAAYRQIVSDFVQVDVAAWALHLGTFGLVSWITGGYLRAVAFRNDAPPVLPRERSFAGLGNIEIGTVLGTLNLLFLTFVIVQFRYLFGGAALVESTLGVTFAEYAREGFFQLVTVACLVVPMLWLLDWVRNPGSSATPFRYLALTMIGLLAVIMVSALYRMRLYQSEFGLTELRYYTTAFMLWLAMVLAWFALTVLRGRRNRFVSGALTAAAAVVFGLHIANPDAWIVRANVGHATQSERPFDAAYAASLSADALPMLVAVLPELPPASQAELRGQLARKRDLESTPGWRSWNWSRSTGAELLARTGID